MPRRIRPKNQQRHDRDRVKPLALANETRFSGKLLATLAIGSFFSGLITASTAVWIAFGTPTNYEYTQILNQKTILTFENEKLKEESKSLQGAINRSKNELSENTNDIEIQKSNINKLRLDKEKSEEEMFILIEKKKFLDKQNISLSERNIELERRSKEILFRAFFHLVDIRIIILSMNPIIPIFAKGDESSANTVTVISCNIYKTFTKDCWNLAIERIVKLVNREDRGKKFEIRPSRPVTLESVVRNSINQIDEWDNLSKEFNQELRTKLNGYVQNNQETFKIPLNFMLTGLDMKVTDANKERKRLLSVLHSATYVGEKEFRGMPHAEVFKLSQYLGYNPP